MARSRVGPAKALALDAPSASTDSSRSPHACTISTTEANEGSTWPCSQREITDVVVPNEHEAAYLAREEAAPGELARKLHQQWPQSCVIVTAGEAGAYVCDTQGEEYHAVAPTVDVVDTTGAGDAFLGALAVRLRGGDRLAEAVQEAVIVASRSVTLAGSIPSYGTSEAVADWAARRQESRLTSRHNTASLRESHEHG